VRFVDQDTKLSGPGKTQTDFLEEHI
jgi:hypothetical protein